MGWGTSHGTGGRKHLSLIEMILLRHLKAGFGKGANHRCDCDGYRPGTAGSAFEVPQLRPQDFVSDKSNEPSQAKS